MKIIGLILLVLLVSCSSKKVAYQCQSSREYVTTLGYLRKHKEFVLKETDARALANEVSKHCSGAAARFVKVTNLLSQAGLTTQDAISNGKRFAKSDDETTESFIQIFRESYYKKFLDLSLYSSLKTAQKLSIDYKGNGKKAREDFHRLVRFCVSEDDLDLPKFKCSQMAAEITELGQNFKKDMAKPFISLYKFLAFKGSGPKRPMYEALDIAREIIKNGPQSSENFIIGYNFAISKRGLGFNKRQAINFAKLMASRTLETKAE